MAKRSPVQIIGEKGEELYRTLLPIGFVANRQERDYGIDFVNECFSNEGTQSTGKFFLTQVKSSTRLRHSRGYVCQQLETIRLKDYCAPEYMLPVFLVVIDVHEKEGYWICLQQINPDHFGNDYENKQSLTIRIPEQNKLSDHVRFTEAVLHACQTLPGKHLLGFSELIQKPYDHLQTLDSRLTARIEMDSTACTVSFTALESFTFEIQPVSTEASMRLNEVIRTGKTAEFNAEDLHFRGSPIFDLFKQQGFEKYQLSLAAYDPFEIRIQTIDSTGSETSTLCCIQGIARKGTEVATFAGIACDGIVQFNMEIEQNRCVKLNNYLRVDEWEGDPIRTLPYFETIHRFIERQANGDRVIITLHLRGRKVGPIVLPRSENKILKTFQLLNILFKIRAIASITQSNPPMPAAFDEETTRTINLLYDLLFGGGAKGTIQTPIHMRPFLGQQADKSQAWIKDNEFSFKMKLQEPQTWSFLGETVTIDGLELLNNSTHFTNKPQIEQALMEGREVIELEFEPSQEWILKRSDNSTIRSTHQCKPS